MNRKVWLNNEIEKPCPNCDSGYLGYNSKNTKSSETLESLEANEYHKNGIVYPTTTTLITTHFVCKECDYRVAAMFERIDDVRLTDEYGNDISIWNPVLYHPVLKIISIPGNAPEEIKAMIQSSFGLYWYDLNSCGNKIRAGLELLMDHENVTKTNSKGKEATLHFRLEEYAKLNAATPEIGEYLEAVKWIGNFASHGGTLDKNQLLNAYELLEVIFEHVFQDKKTRLREMSDRITSAKGKPS